MVAAEGLVFGPRKVAKARRGMPLGGREELGWEGDGGWWKVQVRRAERRKRER